MGAEYLNRYQELMRGCELELQEAPKRRNDGDFAPERRGERAREMVGEMGFCRNISDLWGVRIRVLTRRYRAEPFALERLRPMLNAKAIVISRAVSGRYEVVRAPPRLASVFATLIDFPPSGSKGRITN